MSGETPPDRGMAYEPPKGGRENIGLIAGFLGWYLVNGLAWLLNSNDDSGLACFLFPLNMIVLIVFLIKWRAIGLGILGALALNLLISLVLSTVMNGTCAIPFWVSYG